MTNRVLAEVVDGGMISISGYISFEEAEELLKALPALIVKAKEQYKVKLQLNIAKAEDHLTKLHRDLETLP